MEIFQPSEYGNTGKRTFVTREQFLAVVREVLKDIDMISNGSVAGVEPCDNPVENCLFCKDFFLCLYKRYAESFPPGEIEDFLYCPDLERVENEPHT